MNKNIKSSILICLVLGSLFYLLSKTKTTEHQQTSAKDTTILIDKKPLPLPAPKPLYLSRAQKNYLEVGDSVSKR